MQIPDKLREKWDVLRSPGDIDKISESVSVSSQTIRNAFFNGFCSDEVFTAIASFYEKKEELIKQYI